MTLRFANATYPQKNAAFGLIQKQRDLFSTGGGTRTHMRLLSPDFESGASANSATPAQTIVNRLGLASEGDLDFIKYLN
jgi:hypothetical protein